MEEYGDDYRRDYRAYDTAAEAEAQDGLVDAVVPAWLQVVPSTLRILVHQLPERAQIEVPLQEQLIVELYSK